MAYWRLFYHMTFATKNREPLITSDIEHELHNYLTNKAMSLGAIVHAVNGTSDHVHLVASVPPKIALAQFVGQLKGASSHHINALPDHSAIPFEWQRGYGVVSFGQKALSRVMAYVERQKEHHRTGELIHGLEHMSEEEERPSLPEPARG